MPYSGLFAEFSARMWYIALITETAAFVRLLARGLGRLLPFFCLYLATDVTRSIALWSLGGTPDTSIYQTVWIATEPWAMVLDFLVALELYRVLYQAYPGIHRFGQFVIVAGMIVAAIVTFGTLSLDLHRITWQVPDVQRLFLLKRVVSTWIAVILAVTMTTFPRARCAVIVIRHGWLLTGLFSVRALGLFLAIVGDNSDRIRLPFLGAQCGLYLLWSFWLRKPVTVPPPRSAEEVARTEKWNRELLDATNWLVRF